MARKKKPALNPDGSGPVLESDPLEVTPDPYIVPEPEKAPKLAAESPKPVVSKPKAKPNRGGIKLEVFLRISGKKLDQMAGFRRYAINHGLKQMDTKDWQKEYAKFRSLPV
jgi:hypothetical protein